MRTMKNNSEPPFTSDDILWQLCNNDPILFDTIKEQIRVEDRLTTETDEVYKLRLFDRAGTLRGIVQNLVTKNELIGLQTGDARIHTIPALPEAILTEAGVEMSFAE